MVDMHEQWKAEMTSAEMRSTEALASWLGPQSEVAMIAAERDALRADDLGAIQAREQAREDRAFALAMEQAEVEPCVRAVG